MGFFSTRIDEMVPPAGSATEYAVAELTALLGSIRRDWRSTMRRQAGDLNTWRHKDDQLGRADKAAIIIQWQNNPSALWDLAYRLLGGEYDRAPYGGPHYDTEVPLETSIASPDGIIANPFTYPLLDPIDVTALRIDRLLRYLRSFDLHGADLDPAGARAIARTLTDTAMEIVTQREAARIAGDYSAPYGAREHFEALRDELDAQIGDREARIIAAHAALQDLARDHLASEQARRAAAPRPTVTLPRRIDTTNRNPFM